MDEYHRRNPTKKIKQLPVSPFPEVLNKREKYAFFAESHNIAFLFSFSLSIYNAERDLTEYNVNPSL